MNNTTPDRSTTGAPVDQESIGVPVVSSSGDVNNSPSPFIQAMTREERVEYMRSLGARSNASRLVLSSEEAEALAGAYALIRRVYERHAAKLDALIGEGADDVP